MARQALDYRQHPLGDVGLRCAWPACGPAVGRAASLVQHDGAGDGRTGTGLTSPCASCARAIGCSAARMWTEIPHMGLLWCDRSGPRPEATFIANHRAFVSVPPPPHPMPSPLPAACCRSSCAPAVSSCSPALASSLRSSLAPLLSFIPPSPRAPVPVPARTRGAGFFCLANPAVVVGCWSFCFLRVQHSR